MKDSALGEQPPINAEFQKQNRRTYRWDGFSVIL
jgi:hypothetical protein